MDAKRFLERAVRQSDLRESPENCRPEQISYTFVMEANGEAGPLFAPASAQLVIEFNRHQLLLHGIQVA